MLCLPLCDSSQQEYDGLRGGHGVPHLDDPLVFPVEPLYPIGGVYAALHPCGEVHIGEVCDAALGLVFPQGGILLPPLVCKGNKLFVLPQGVHLFVLHAERLFELLRYGRLVLVGHAVEHLPLEMGDAELVRCRGESRANGILDALQGIGDNEVHLAYSPVLQCLKLGIPAQGPLGGVVHDREHLAAAVLPHGKDGVVSLLGHLSVAAGGDERGINVEHRVVVLQPAGEPLHDVLAAGARQPGHLLLAVRAPVDGLRYLAYLLSGKAVGVKETEQLGTLLTLAAACVIRKNFRNLQLCKFHFFSDILYQIQR